MLEAILDTKISPELVPADAEGGIQSTEDRIGPYELHDFFLFHILRIGPAAVEGRLPRLAGVEGCGGRAVADRLSRGV